MTSVVRATLVSRSIAAYDVPLVSDLIAASDVGTVRVSESIVASDVVPVTVS